MATLTARECNQDVSAARRAADRAPVVTRTTADFAPMGVPVLDPWTTDS